MKKAKKIANVPAFILVHFQKIESALKEAERAFYQSDTLLEDICLK